jgi:hypothetical protein
MNLLISVRGIQVRADPERRLDDAVRQMIESKLIVGQKVDLETRNIVRMCKQGGFVVPNDVKNDYQLAEYCSSILRDFNPNHGTIKKERMAFGFRYEFIPDIPRKEVQT